MTTPDDKTEPEPDAEMRGEEIAAARAAGLPDLHLGSDIEAEAAAALAEAVPEPEDAAAKAARLAAEADAMTEAAMRAPAEDPLIPPLAAALAEQAAGGDMAVLGAVWKPYAECCTVTDADIEALLNKWEAGAREAIYGPLKDWLDAGLTGMAAPAYVA